MAEDDQARHPSTGNGAGSAGGGSVFTRKLGPLPVWAWMGIGLGVALALSSWRKNKATNASAASTVSPSGTVTGVQTAAQTPPFVIQNYTTSPGGGSTRRQRGGTTTGTSSATTTTTGGNPVGSSANEEPYLYGHSQLDYIQQHLQSATNSTGYAQNVYQDVLNAYTQVVHSQGQTQADAYHYSWIGPGNVQAIPQNSLSASQILQNLP